MNQTSTVDRPRFHCLFFVTAIWELAERLSAAEQIPDQLPVDRIAAELSNHLIPGVVLTPGAVATLVNLQQAGFAYSR